MSLFFSLCLALSHLPVCPRKAFWTVCDNLVWNLIATPYCMISRMVIWYFRVLDNFWRQRSQLRLVSNPFQRYHLDHGYGLERVVRTAVVIHSNSLLVPFFNKIRRTATDESKKCDWTGPNIISMCASLEIGNPYVNEAWISYYRSHLRRTKQKGKESLKNSWKEEKSEWARRRMLCLSRTVLLFLFLVWTWVVTVREIRLW